MLNMQLNEDIGKLILRLTAGGLMIFHGVAKLGDGGALNWIGRQLSEMGLPSVIAYGVYIGEIVAPLMVIAGVYCRIGAGLMVVNILFAVGLVHMAEVLTLNEQGGYALELHAFYLLVSAALLLMGSGRFAVRPD